jgi:hypothetical protein
VAQLNALAFAANSAAEFEQIHSRPKALPQPPRKCRKPPRGHMKQSIECAA